MPLFSNTPELHREFAQWYRPDTSERFHVPANGYDADILEAYVNAPPAVALPLILTYTGNLYGGSTLWRIDLRSSRRS